MALSFLNNIGIGDIIDIGQAGVGIAGLFKKQKVPGEIRSALSTNRSIANALMNPDDSMFQRLVGQEEDRIRREFAGALQQLMVANRRSTARGTNLLNPERRDEALAMATARGHEEAQDQARQAARRYLLNAANVNNAAFNTTAPLMQMDALNRQNQASGIEAAFDLARGTVGMLDGTPSTTLNLNIGGGRSGLPSVYQTRY